MYFKRGRARNVQGSSQLHSFPTVITTGSAGVKAEAAQTGSSLGHAATHPPYPPWYLAVQEKVVWFDVSVDESKLVNGVYG